MERDEPPESSFGQVVRQKLREFDQLKELTEEQAKTLRACSATMEQILSILKAPSEELPPDLLQAKVKIQERRNERLKEQNEKLQEENERLRRKVKGLQLTDAIKQSDRIQVLGNELQRLRKENAELRDRLAGESEQTEAQKMVRAVADAAEEGKEWDSGADLKRWLAEDEEFHCSASTVERRLETAGVWVRPGRKGRSAVDETVSKCLQAI